MTSTSDTSTGGLRDAVADADGNELQGSILERFPVGDPVTITFESVVEGTDAERLYEAYRMNFEPLEELAVLQQCFSREEVLAELSDPAITKIVGWQGRTPVGLGMVTNYLDAVPQISPRALRARYPEHAATDSIYFGILVAVSPEHRGMTLFNRIYLELWNIPATAGGVLVFDICEFNRTAFDTDSLVQRIGSNFPGSEVGVVDRQTWYAAELPHPIPGS
ncbi:hypothetical protein [Ilumatobacter sp.]|uniref:hypothetical protein n=1 Tax=Ilumatobacter sp. TaxID=1967498 RepID=UPI003B51A22F